MKFTQVVAVGAALVAQAQACTRIHVEAWNENGQEYKNIELYDNNNPVLYMARDTSVKDTSYYYYTVPGNKKYGVRLMKDSTNPDKIAGAVEFSPTNFGEIFTQGYSSESSTMECASPNTSVLIMDRRA